jgi:hypothetical protein
MDDEFLEHYGRLYGGKALAAAQPFAPSQACLGLAIAAIVASYMFTRPGVGAALVGALWLKTQMDAQET